MAESVEFQIEQTLPQLEQMERVGLFTNQEIKSIIKNRREYEYKMKRTSKSKEDILKYIQYEMNLLNLLKYRRIKIGYNFKKGDIDHAIIQGINRLFRVAVFRYQDDVNLWLSHIEFLKKMGWSGLVSKMFVRMLQMHNGIANVWIAAAKWEFEGNKSSENARSIMQRGLRFLPKNRSLWLEYFKLELLITEKVKKRREILGIDSKQSKEKDKDEDKEEDAIISGKVAKIVYNNAIKEIDDLSFKISFLKILSEFDSIQEVEEDVYDCIKKESSNSEIALDALSRRPLLNINKNGDTKEKISLRNTEAKVFTSYDKALETMNTEKMWSLYIEFCFEQLELCKSEKKAARILHQLLKVLNLAFEQDKLSELNFRRMIQLLDELENLETLDCVLEKAITKYPCDELFWRKFIQLKIGQDLQPDEILQLFLKSVKLVPHKRRNILWTEAVKYAMIAKPNEVKNLLESAIISCRNDSLELQNMYLEWSSIQSGLKDTREVYNWIIGNVRCSSYLINKMVFIEEAQVHPKVEIMRSYFEGGIKDLGTKDIEIWLNYIKFEMNHVVGKKTNCENLYWRAVKTLDSSLTDDFISAHTIMQAK